MNYKNYLIFDFGASNGRAIIAKFNGSRFGIEVIHRFDNKPVYVSDTLYFDILRLFSELNIGILSSVKKYKNITSIGIDTWASDFGFIDKNGKIISNLVHYRDRKRHDVAQKLFNIIPKKELFELTGGIFLTSLGLFHMFSLKLQNATELLNAYKFLMVPDIFNYFLTGELFNEFTNATTTLLYNQKKRKWEDKILNKIGISKDIFCQIIMPGAKIGNIAKELCSELEIKSIPVIVPATHDSASVVAGIPITNKEKNWAFISIGTWYVIGVETDSPIINENVFKLGYANFGGVEELNIFAKSVTGLWIIQQCRKTWIKERGKDISWNEIVRASFLSEPFELFININDLQFSKTQINMPSIISEYCKDTGQYIPKDMGDISRCIYESIVMSIKYNLNSLEKLINRKIKLFKLVGGGIKNKLLCQWIADATGVLVSAGSPEATSIGNLLMQLKGTGEIDNLEQGREIASNSIKAIYYKSKNKERWDDAYERYLKIH